MAWLHSRASRSGVTLLEFLVSLVILGALAAFSGGALQPLGRVGSLRRATEELAAAIREGQSHALASRVEHELRVGEMGWALFASNPLDDTRPIRATSFPTGVVGVVGSDQLTRLRFFPTGTVSPRTVVLSSGGYTGRITASLRGRVTVKIE